MLNVLSPLIVDGKLNEATAAMELSGARDADSFLAYYRRLKEPVKQASDVITPNTPVQIPYVQDLSAYSSLMGGDA